jgi:hypothetical protein
LRGCRTQLTTSTGLPRLILSTVVDKAPPAKIAKGWLLLVDHAMVAIAGDAGDLVLRRSHRAPLASEAQGSVGRGGPDNAADGTE